MGVWGGCELREPTRRTISPAVHLDGLATDNPLDALEQACIWIGRLPVGAAWTDGERLCVNQLGADLVGRSVTDLTTVTDWFAAVYGSDAAQHQQEHVAKRVAGTPGPTLLPIVDQDGSERPIELTTIRDGGGEFWLLRDRSRAGALEREARAVIESLRAVGEHLPGMLYQYRVWPDGRRTFPCATEGMERLYGVTTEEAMRDASLALQHVHPGDRARLAASIRTSEREGTVWRQRYRVQHPTRGLRWLQEEASPERLDDSGTVWYGYAADVTEFQAMESALQDSQKLLQTVFDATEASLFVVDVDGDEFRYSAANAAHERLYDIPNAAFLGKRASDFVSKEDAEVIEGRYRVCVRERRPIVLDEHLPIPRPGAWHRTSLVPIMDAEGRVRRIVGSAFETTEIRKVQESLRERDALLDRAQRAGGLGTWALDLNSWEFTFAPAVEAVLGPLPNRHLVAMLRRRIHPDDLRRTQREWREALLGKKPLDVTVRMQRDGKDAYLRLRAERAESDQPRLVGTVQDVDEAKRRQDEATRLATIVEQAPSIVMLTDLEGRIEYVNSAFEVASGYAASEVLGQVASRFAADEEDACASSQAMWEALKAGTPWVGSFDSRRADGTRYREQATVSPLIDGEGKTTHLLKLAEDVTVRERLVERVAYLSAHDRLTGLPNRTYFSERVTGAFEAARRHHDRIAVLMIDVDAFSTVNDGLGQRAGDALLTAVARRLGSLVRAADVVARVGGDEFGILLERVGSLDDVAAVVSKIRDGFREPFEVARRPAQVSVTIGAAVYPGDAEDADALMRYADVALHRAKESGAASVAYYTESMQQRLDERVRMDAAMRAGLANGELRLVYQPRVDMANGRIVSLEALARWRSPRFGDVPPGSFIPVAEATGFIIELGNWVIREAIGRIAAFRAAGLPLVPVAVNVAARQFVDGNVVDVVAAALEQAGVPAELFEVEITESAAMADVSETVQKVRALEELGVAVSIDDFGTTHSSLGRLKQLDVGSLKIDQSFVRDLGDDPDAAPHDAAIVRAIIGIAQALDIGVIAEGVETKAQRDFLLQHGCRIAQGYLFARPGEVDEVEGWLRAGRVDLA